MPELASYAASDNTSRGRIYNEPGPGSMRGEYQRDRDRIVHSSAFRRLEYKTQVFVNHEGDMFRTRLTHSIEVSQIGRTFARALKLNEDLTEAICLAHDLGHTPFGHAGQDALNECMRDLGGFEHNLQSLRVVEVLEERYADFPGLNLTYETREGILKHCSRNNAKKLGELGLRFLNGEQPGLEAQLANVADEIAYNSHDIDDGLRADFITVEQLCECTLFNEQYEIVKGKYPQLPDSQMRSELIRRIINTLVTDLVETSLENIRAHKLTDINSVRQAGKGMIALSETMQKKNLELKQFLRNHLYQHYRVQRMAHKAKSIIVLLFETFMHDHKLMPHDIQQKFEHKTGKGTEESRARVIADYIAGMTDRYAIAEYGRITDPLANSY